MATGSTCSKRYSDGILVIPKLSHPRGSLQRLHGLRMLEIKKLEDRIAIRPTSETIIYPHFSDLIKVHRDLPLKTN
ncbi:hypothetical protein MKX03_008431, partial [Papaver bracteatum]